jgi:hypothetical protein
LISQSANTRSSKVAHEPSVVVHTYNPCSLEAEAGGEFEASMVYTARPCLKNKKMLVGFTSEKDKVCVDYG